LTNISLHYGWDERRYSDNDCAKIFMYLPEAYISDHSGFFLREVLHEVYGPKEKDALLSGGFQVLRDHPALRTDPSFSGVTGSQHPYLMEANRKTLPDWHGNLLAMLFHKPTHPRFFFTPAQQDVLLLALPGATDGEIAKALRVSPWTVKKRWQGIYEKVEAVDSGILGDPPSGLSKEEVPKQKRRHLLNYLRNYSEELRPFLATRRNKKSPT
jgi:hypothetical protein